jgi:hypothetical protein
MRIWTFVLELEAKSIDEIADFAKKYEERSLRDDGKMLKIEWMLLITATKPNHAVWELIYAGRDVNSHCNTVEITEQWIWKMRLFVLLRFTFVFEKICPIF